jgi:DNA repair photolyase
MQSIIDYRLSFVTLDPIQGCPYDCVYCLWRPYGLTNVRPSQPLCSAKELYSRLGAYLSEHRFGELKATIPIAIGNVTDMCATADNRRYLLEVLESHSRFFPKRPFVIQTKAVLTDAFMSDLDSFAVPIVLMISAVFFPSWRRFESGTPSPLKRLANFERASKTQHVMGVHFWRPVTAIDLDSVESIREQVRLLKQSGSQVSVLAGLMLTQQVAESLRSDSTNPMHDYYKAYSSLAVKQMLIPDLYEQVLEIAQAEGYPVYYRQTSCAISYLLKQPDYFSSFRFLYRDRCMKSYCPQPQRDICSSYLRAHAHPSTDVLIEIANWLGLMPDKVTYSEEVEAIFVDATLPQGNQNFLSHKTGYLVRGRLVLSNSQWEGTHVPA